MKSHAGVSVAAIRHAISSHLKMAPYRQGGAGKDASLVVSPPDGSDVETDVETDQ